MPNEAESEKCSDCDGKGYLDLWAWPQCPRCKGSGKKPPTPPTGSGEVLEEPIPESIVYSRCAKHYQVPQQNKNEHSGHECGGCIAEERDWYKLQYEAIKIEINLRLDELSTLRQSDEQRGMAIVALKERLIAADKCIVGWQKSHGELVEALKDCIKVIAGEYGGDNWRLEIPRKSLTNAQSLPTNP